MSEQIPDDVMKRARLLIYETIGAVDFPNGKFLIEGYYDDSLIDAIARALMEERAAERERAAKIADAQAENARLGDLEDHAFAAEVASERIAAAIRGQP